MCFSWPRPRVSPLLLAFALVLAVAGSGISQLHPIVAARAASPTGPSMLGDRLHDGPLHVTVASVPAPASLSIAPVPAMAIGRLVISSIGVSAPAYTVDLDASGAVGVVSGLWDVGWYDRSAAIGSPGTALIEGHLDWYTGRAIFWDLHRVGAGDVVMFRQPGGDVLTFRVSEIRYVAYNTSISSDLVATSGKPRMALITCAGTWLTRAHTYSQRLIVIADRLS